VEMVDGAVVFAPLGFGRFGAWSNAEEK
jgi:hypothetical protein